MLYSKRPRVPVSGVFIFAMWMGLPQELFGQQRGKSLECNYCSSHERKCFCWYNIPFISHFKRCSTYRVFRLCHFKQTMLLICHGTQGLLNSISGFNSSHEYLEFEYYKQSHQHIFAIPIPFLFISLSSPCPPPSLPAVSCHLTGRQMSSYLVCMSDQISYKKDALCFAPSSA